jgi:NAD dependent epimerase/dehydratase family enzyme
MVRLGSRLLLRTDPDLALLGRYVVPRRLLDEGHEFAFTDLDAALADIVREDGPGRPRRLE